MDMFPEAIGISPVADTVHPPGEGSRGGRPSFSAVGFRFVAPDHAQLPSAALTVAASDGSGAWA